MSLEVIVASATDLPNVESVGKTDPYVSVEYLGIVYDVHDFSVQYRSVIRCSLRLPYFQNPGHAVLILPRCMQCRRGLAMRFLSVRLSVCLSVCQTRAL